MSMNVNKDLCGHLFLNEGFIWHLAGL